MRITLIALLLLVVVLGAGGYAALKYATSVPGQSHQGPLPPLTAEERAIAATLRRHIEVVAAREHNVAHFDELEKVAVYLEGVLSSLGYTLGRQEYVVDGKKVRNIDAVIEARGTDPEVIVVGAHYDSAPDTPGANDNASGTASVLELARLLGDLKGKTDKRIRFVLFVNEEPPYFWTEQMGSVHYAKALAARKERVVAMFSLETLGYYSDEPGSQNYPPPFGLMFPNRGDFVSFVITDTATFRYPHYHEPTDTPDKVDVERLARITKGMERVVRDLAR